MNKRTGDKSVDGGKAQGLLTVIWGREMERWVDKFDGSCLLSTPACPPSPTMKSAFAPVAAALLLASNAMAQLTVNTPYASPSV